MAGGAASKGMNAMVGAAQGMQRGGSKGRGKVAKRLALALLSGKVSAGKKGQQGLGWAQLAPLVAMAVGRTALANRQAQIHGELFRASFMKNVPHFARCLLENMVVALALSWLDGQYNHRLTLLNLSWRERLTSMLHGHYFKDMVYYKLHNVDRSVANPEQRICEDVPKFSHGLVQVVGDTIPALVDVIFYSVRLYQTSRTNKYTAMMMAYIVGAGAVISTTSPNFGKLFRKQQELEGEYRSVQARLRSNAESIALYGGINVERGKVLSRFQSLRQQIESVLHKQWAFGMVSDFVLKYLGATASVYMIIGPFFEGHMRPDEGKEGRAEMLSRMRYHTSIVISLFTSLGIVGGADQKLLKLGAFADRIYELRNACKRLESSEAKGATEGQLQDSDNISFEGVSVTTPTGTQLIEGLSLTVKPGTNLLVTGPNGSGKSSLFRVLGGLWPFTEGRVSKPGGTSSGLASEIYYVPQRPYVSVGTLLEQLTYPETPGERASLEGLGPEGLEALLRQVDLQHLLVMYNPEDVVNWGDVLSLGEQQRLGMARLFYHKPKFAILDECTSGVTTDMEERFCDIVREMGCTCITISHRPALVAFHDVALHLDGEGGWTLKKLEHAEAPEHGPAGRGVGDRARQSSEVFDGMLRRSRMAKARLPSEDNLHLGAVVAECPPQEEEGQLEAARAHPNRELPGREWKLLKMFLPSWGSADALNVTLLAAVIGCRTALSDRIANLNGRSVQHVLHQDKSAFVRLLMTSVVQSLASAITAPSLKYLTDRLAVSWRARLTEALAGKFLTGNTFYSVIHLQGMKDADQRITRDVERLCDDVAALVPSMVKPIVDVCWFTWRCYTLTGLRGLAILYSYNLLGYGFLRAVTPSLGKFAANEFELEGAFRYSHSRLGAASESVAFFGGGEREGESITARFRALTTHIQGTSAARLTYNVCDTYLTKHLPHSVTWIVSLLFAMDHPADFSSTEGQGVLVRDMRYLATAVTNNFVAFGEILGLHKRFAELAGGVDRVSLLLSALEVSLSDAQARDFSFALPRAEAETGTLASYRQALEGPPEMDFDHVDVVSPKGKLLVRNLTMEVMAGRNLLVTGPNGSGKSSIFRSLAGLWPLGAGAITVGGRGPGLSDLVFNVPQRPYTALGTLREQIIYPHSLREVLGSGQFGSRGELDEHLDRLMAAVRLTYLVERWGWGAVTEWGDRLSLGEQQRIGMARLFYHAPRFAILDECTNATSVDIEESLYQHAQKMGITLVTISQRPALIKFHAQELRLIDGKGAWSLHNIAKGPPAPTSRRSSFLDSDSD
mmetsp:Transcript_35427/g.99833  ORF Transcript_35427/g.99833 Transcript_35427/m.99833 type:complete len:1301 (+) Transcript_35427:15-3917(+)